MCRDITSIEDRRTWAVNQLHALIRNGSVPNEDEWVIEVLDLLLVHGFFTIRKANKKSEMAVVSLVSGTNATGGGGLTFMNSCILRLALPYPRRPRKSVVLVFLRFSSSLQLFHLPLVVSFVSHRSP